MGWHGLARSRTRYPLLANAVQRLLTAMVGQDREEANRLQKSAQICGDPAEFWPQRLLAFELRRWGNAARASCCRDLQQALCAEVAIERPLHLPPVLPCPGPDFLRRRQLVRIPLPPGRQRFWHYR